MAIITFYSTDYKETGQTVSMAAIITYMAIKHNYKMLGISTSFRDITLENCFWKQENESNTNAKFLNSNLVGVGSGIEGLSKVLIANRSSENLVTNYARVVFKDRLEILSSPQVKFYSDYRKICESYPMAIEESKKNYDLVFVDFSLVLFSFSSSSCLLVFTAYLVTFSVIFSISLTVLPNSVPVACVFSVLSSIMFVSIFAIS